MEHEKESVLKRSNDATSSNQLINKILQKLIINALKRKGAGAIFGD